jgi:Pretoxin HINT domain
VRQQVKQSFLGAVAVMTMAIPVADILDVGALGDETAGAIGTGEDTPVTCGAGASFAAGTKVVIASGAAVPIASLTPGEKVLATNVATGKNQAEPIAAVLVRHDTDRYDLKIRAGRGIAVIETTRNHLFWDLTRRRWVRADALGRGDRLRTPSRAAAIRALSWG